MIGVNDFETANLVKTVIKSYNPEIILLRDINFSRIDDFVVLDDEIDVNPKKYVGNRCKDVVGDTRDDSRILTTFQIDELCYMIEVEHLKRYNERITDVDYYVRSYGDFKSVEMRCNTNKYVREDIVNEPFYSPSDSALNIDFVNDIVESPEFDSLFKNTSQGKFGITEEYKEEDNDEDNNVIQILNSSGKLSECESCGKYTGIPEDTDGNICIYCSDKQFKVVKNRIVYSTEEQMIQDSFKYEDCDNRDMNIQTTKMNINNDNTNNISKCNENNVDDSSNDVRNIKKSPIVDGNKVKVSVSKSTTCNCRRCTPDSIEQRAMEDMRREARSEKFGEVTNKIEEDDRLAFNSNYDVRLIVDDNDITISASRAVEAVNIVDESNVIESIESLLSKFKKREFNVIDNEYNLVKLDGLNDDYEELFVAQKGSDKYSKAEIYDSDKNIYRIYSNRR